MSFCLLVMKRVKTLNLIREIKMNSKVYKWCAVPQCKNTSIKTPNKVFVHVPNKKSIRHKWLKLARRNPNDVVTNSPLYFCEDHFDLPNDMENYMEYHVMGSVSQVRMKPGCMPHKFICQPDEKPRISDTTEQHYIAKKRKVLILEDCEKEFEGKCIVTEQSGFEEIASGSSGVRVESSEYTQQDLSETIKLECLSSSLQSHKEHKIDSIKCEEFDIHYEHIKLDSVKEEPNESDHLFPCGGCEMVFSSEKDLTEHKIAELECIALEEDGTGWNIEDSLIQDFGMHQPGIKNDVSHEKVQVSKIYKCRACRERCRQKEDLRHHEKIHVHLSDHTYALFPSENSYG